MIVPSPASVIGCRLRASTLGSFGARAIREHLTRHLSLAQQLASWVDQHADFERLAPVPFSVVCFRWNPAAARLAEIDLDRANERLLNAINQSGDAFLSHTRVGGRFALRMAIGHIRTQEEHVRRAWDLLCNLAGTA